MRCLYCEAEVTTYPENGICIHCGGRLPPRPQGKRCPGCGNYSMGNFCSHCGRSLNGDPSPYPPQPSYPPPPNYPPVPPYQQMLDIPGIRCPKCRSTNIRSKQRGFSWGLAILGFFLFPFVGLFLGFCGSRNIRRKCTSCGYRWKRD